jgi:hypothetical protein
MPDEVVGLAKAGLQTRLTATAHNIRRGFGILAPLRHDEPRPTVARSSPLPGSCAASQPLHHFALYVDP